MSLRTSRLSPGFPDPVFGAQGTFRALLSAMAHPGRIVSVGSDLEPPPPLSRAAGAVLLSLADFETPLWSDLAPSHPVFSWLRFHTGCPCTQEPAGASFALVTAPRSMPPFSAFSQGTDEFPERGATLLLEVSSLAAGSGLRLIGPGIAAENRLGVGGLPEAFPRWLRENGAAFPRGVDLVLTCGAALAAIPRTTRLAEDAPCT